MPSQSPQVLADILELVLAYLQIGLLGLAESNQFSRLGNIEPG